MGIGSKPLCGCWKMQIIANVPPLPTIWKVKARGNPSRSIQTQQLLEGKAVHRGHLHLRRALHLHAELLAAALHTLKPRKHTHLNPKVNWPALDVVVVVVISHLQAHNLNLFETFIEIFCLLTNIFLKKSKVNYLA